MDLTNVINAAAAIRVLFGLLLQLEVTILRDYMVMIIICVDEEINFSFFVHRFNTS